MSYIKTNSKSGFTIVELLIVIVVIAILAAISIVSYNGIQQRARDSQRKTDISVLEKVLELYYIDKGEYPPSGANCNISGYNGGATTADKDGCWATFMGYLKPYTNSQTIIDPSARAVVDSSDLYDSTNYTITTYYCNRQTYLLLFNTETPRFNPAIQGGFGDCAAGSAGYPATSTRHVIMKSKV